MTRNAADSETWHPQRDGACSTIVPGASCCLKATSWPLGQRSGSMRHGPTWAHNALAEPVARKREHGTPRSGPPLRYDPATPLHNALAERVARKCLLPEPSSTILLTSTKWSGIACRNTSRAVDSEDLLSLARHRFRESVPPCTLAEPVAPCQSILHLCPSLRRHSFGASATVFICGSLIHLRRAERAGRLRVARLIDGFRRGTTPLLLRLAATQQWGQSPSSSLTSP